MAGRAQSFKAEGWPSAAGTTLGTARREAFLLIEQRRPLRVTRRTAGDCSGPRRGVNSLERADGIVYCVKFVGGSGDIG